MHTVRTIGLSLILLATATCRSNAVFGVSAIGEPAGVEFSSVQAAGGQVTRTTITVDSATARFEAVTCSGGVTGECVETERTSGLVASTELHRLFATAQTREFRALRDEYPRDSDFVPPDGGSSTLTITVGERAKAVTWDKHSTIPELLARYVCWLNAIRGSLILCA